MTRHTPCGSILSHLQETPRSPLGYELAALQGSKKPRRTHAISQHVSPGAHPGSRMSITPTHLCKQREQRSSREIFQGTLSDPRQTTHGAFQELGLPATHSSSKLNPNKPAGFAAGTASTAGWGSLAKTAWQSRAPHGTSLSPIHSHFIRTEDEKLGAPSLK